MRNFEASTIRVQDLDHSGIIAGICDEMGLVEQIDKLLGTHPQEIISPGRVVKAIILNGLGFVSAPLYLFEKFFVGKATEHLTHGYSRDHRPDLKQFIVDLMCSGDGDIPLYLRVGDGNETDSAMFGKLVTQFKQQWDIDALFVADAAL